MDKNTIETKPTCCQNCPNLIRRAVMHDCAISDVHPDANAAWMIRELPPGCPYRAGVEGKEEG